MGALPSQLASIGRTGARRWKRQPMEPKGAPPLTCGGRGAPRVGIEPTSLVLIQSQAGPASRPTGERPRRGRAQGSGHPAYRRNPDEQPGTNHSWSPVRGWPTYANVGYVGVGSSPREGRSPMTTFAPEPTRLQDPPAPSSPAVERKGTGEQIALGFFIVVPFLALLAAVPIAWGWGLGWRDVVLAFVMYAIAGHGITVGFHRYFTHGSFKARRWLRVTLAIAGSLAIEGPVIRWV